MGSFFGGVASGLSGGGGGGAIKKLADKLKKKKGDSDDPGQTEMHVDSYHKGGKVKKTGLARLKKGERVLTKAQQKKMGMKKKG